MTEIAPSVSRMLVTEIGACFIVSIVVSAAITPPIMWILRKWRVLDMPNERSSHTTPTMRGGGIAIVCTIMLAGVWLFGEQREPMTIAMTGLVGGLAAVSFLDDCLSLSTWLRLGCHLVAAVVMLYLLCRVAGFGWERVAMWPAALVLFLIWLVGYTNAFNFMDGINGLASGQAFVTGLGTALIIGVGGHAWESPLVYLSVAISGAAAGFMPYNFPKARVFMGDAGSAPLGFVLGGLVIAGSWRYGWWLLLPLAMLHANFVLDTGITLVRRIIAGSPWYSAHREHFYQRLVRSGESHSYVTLLELLIQLLVVGLMLLYIKSGTPVKVVAAASVPTIWALFFGFCEITFRWRLRYNEKPIPDIK